MLKFLNNHLLICAFVAIIGRLVIPGHVFGKDSTQVKTALVLSGGGARGFAHIGVIKALEENGFYPDMVIGTSTGALIGALYAAGNSSYEIEQFVKNTNWRKLFSSQSYREIEFVSQKMAELPAIFSLRFDEHFNVIFPKNLLSTQGLNEQISQVTLLADYASSGNFDSLSIPFRAVATDIKTGKSVVLESGDLAKAITASSSYPFILAPVSIDSFLLVDGGLTNNVPCDVARDIGANFIIAVDVSSKIARLGNEFDPFSLWGQAINTISYLSDTRNLHLANVLIYPEMENISSTDFDSVDVLIRNGYEETQRMIAQITPYATHQKHSTDCLKLAYRQLDTTRIRHIRFNDNLKTKNMVIKREMALKEGDLWNFSAARKSVKNLYSTSLFKNVYMTLRKSSPDSADLIFDIQEEHRTMLSFGIRYDSEHETRGFASMKYKNLFGVGIDIQAYLIASDQYSRLALDFRTPRIWTTTMPGYLSLYTEKEYIPLYWNMKRVSFGEFSKSGFELSAGVQVKRVGLTSIGLKLESTNIESDSTSHLIIPQTNYQTGSIIFRVLVENTDDIDLPTRGRINHAYYEHSFNKNKLLLYDRISLESKSYETFNERYTFSTDLRFGYLASALSYYEKFRLGGESSLPGYHQDELWGKVILSVGLGFRAPLTSGIYYQFGLNFGNVWEDIQSFNWRKLILGLKSGIIIPTPIGPASVSYGFNLKERNLLYVSIGHEF